MSQEYYADIKLNTSILQSFTRTTVRDSIDATILDISDFIIGNFETAAVKHKPLENKKSRICAVIPLRSGLLADSILSSLTSRIWHINAPYQSLSIISSAFTLPKVGIRPNVVHKPAHFGGYGYARDYKAVEPVVSSRVVKRGNQYQLFDPEAKANYVEAVAKVIERLYAEFYDLFYEPSFLYLKVVTLTTIEDEEYQDHVIAKEEYFEDITSSFGRGETP